MTTTWKRGSELTPALQTEAKRRFIYRWTSDNARREEVWRRLAKPSIPLISDAEWLATTDFAVTGSGLSFDGRVKHCKPHGKPAVATLDAPFRDTEPGHAHRNA